MKSGEGKGMQEEFNSLKLRILGDNVLNVYIEINNLVQMGIYNQI